MKAGGEGDHRGQDGWMASATNGHEFEQVPGVGDGQGSLACCSPWGCKELDMTELLNNNKTRSEELEVRKTWPETRSGIGSW